MSKSEFALWDRFCLMMTKVVHDERQQYQRHPRAYTPNVFSLQLGRWPDIPNPHDEGVIAEFKKLARFTAAYNCVELPHLEPVAGVLTSRRYSHKDGGLSIRFMSQWDTERSEYVIRADIGVGNWVPT